MQCKDIPDAPILERVWEINNSDSWAHWFDVHHERSVRPAFPPDCPFKLVLAKMRKLIERGLLDGCPCGCRGDYIVTRKGLDLIGKPDHKRIDGDKTF